MNTLVKHTCRNCGGRLDHHRGSGHSAEWVYILDCADCGTRHILRITLTTTKGVAA